MLYLLTSTMAATFHMTDDMISRFNVGGKIMFGDADGSTDINNIEVRSGSITTGTRGIHFTQGAPWDNTKKGTIKFTGDQTITNPLTVSSQGNVEISAELKGESEITITSGCTPGGFTKVTNTGSITTADENKPINIYGGDIDLEGSVSAGDKTTVGDNNITLEHICGTGNFGIGAESAGTEPLYLSQAELILLTANALTLKSPGAMIAYGHAAMHLAHIGIVHMISTTTTTFQTASSSFPVLTVLSPDGITVLENVSTTVGKLDLTFNNGALIVTTSKIEAVGGDLMIESSGSTIETTLPSTMKTNMDFTLDVALNIARPSTTKYLRLSAGDDLNISAAINFATGTQTEDNRTNLLLESKKIAINPTLGSFNANAARDVIIFRPDCDDQTICMILLGVNAAPQNYYHITTAEIARVFSSGRVYIGDHPEFDMIVEKIKVNDFDFGSGTTGVYLTAFANKNGQISFESGESIIEKTLHLLAARTIEVATSSTSIETSQTLLLRSNGDCTNRGVLKLESTATLAAVGNAHLYVGDVEIAGDGSINVGTSDITFTESCMRDNSIGLGGTQALTLANGEARFSLIQSELATLTASDVIFEAALGHVIIRGFTQATHMASISTSTTIIAEDLIDQTVTFQEAKTIINQLTVIGRGGITFDSSIDLDTTSGDLQLTFNDGNLEFSDHVEISVSNGDLILQSSNFQITAQLPVSLETTTGNFDLTLALTGTRAPSDEEAENTLRLKADKWLKCSSTIQLEGGSGALLWLEGGTMESESCVVTEIAPTDGSKDRVLLRPSCTGDDCLMYLGDYTGESGTKYVLSNGELNRITTTGIVLIGDNHPQGTAVVDGIFAKNLAYSSGDTKIIFAAAHNKNGDITFEDTCSFTNALELHANGNVILEEKTTAWSLTSDVSVYVHGDEDCTMDARIEIKSKASLGISTKDVPIKVYGADLLIESDAFIHAGTNVLIIKEMCSISQTQSLAIAAPFSAVATMHLSINELQRFNANMIVFESDKGGVKSYGWTQSSTMNGITTKTVIHADDQTNGLVTFEGDPVVLHSLEARGYIGIDVDQDITITTQNLDLSFTNGNLALSQSVDLIVQSGTLFFTTTGQLISAFSPGSFQAQTITLTMPLIIHRDADESSTFQLKTIDTMNCQDSIELTAASTETTALRIDVGNLKNTQSCTITADNIADEIHINPICTGNGCKMYFGAYFLASNFHLTDIELDMIVTSGILRIGNQVNVEKIEFDGISYASAAQGIYITALHTNAGIEFRNSDSNFVNGLTIMAKGSFSTSIDIQLSGPGKAFELWTNKDCDGTNSSISIDGVITTNSGDIKFYGGSAIVTGESSISTTTDIYVEERCEYDISLSIGGSSDVETMVFYTQTKYIIIKRNLFLKKKKYKI
jgi:hypothetical protein